MSYKTLGDYIQPVNIRNKELAVTTLLGVSIKKVLMPSIANIIGTNMKTYKIIKQNQFAYGPVTSRNGDKISIALLEEYKIAIVSQAYTVFEVINEQKVLPEYLMMWFRRPEFDRYARFKSHGSAREVFDWEELCDTQLPIPSMEKQRQIVDEYNTVANRIKLNNHLNQKLEETAQNIYKEWFLTNDIEPTTLDLNALTINIIDNRGKTPKWILSGIPLVEANAVNTNNPFIDLSKTQKFVTKKVYSNSFRSGHPKEKDILIVTVGSSIGSLAIVSDEICSIAQNIISIRPKAGFGHYLYETLKYRKNDLLSLDIGSAQSSIKVPHLLSMSIDIPDEDLVFKFENIASKLYSKVSINQKQVVILHKLKEILLSKMTKVEAKTAVA